MSKDESSKVKNNKQEIHSDLDEQENKVCDVFKFDIRGIHMLLYVNALGLREIKHKWSEHSRESAESTLFASDFSFTLKGGTSKEFIVDYYTLSELNCNIGNIALKDALKEEYGLKSYEWWGLVDEILIYIFSSAFKYENAPNLKDFLYEYGYGDCNKALSGIEEYEHSKKLYSKLVSMFDGEEIKLIKRWLEHQQEQRSKEND